MGADDVLLRLACTIPAALGAWASTGFFLWILRVRDASLRAGLWTWAAASTALVVVGLPSSGALGLSVVVPTDYPLLRGGAFATAALAAWGAGAVVLVARRAAADRRIAACVEGLAAASPAPDDVVDAVARAARWIGVAAPRVAACQADGTAFVVGTAEPVLFVPLALWRRLDGDGRRAMLLHELAHLRRRDPLRLRALSVVVDVLWPALPLRWTAARLRDAWESQADAEALRGGATRTALARSIVAAWSAAAPAGAAAFGGSSRSAALRLGALRRPTRAAAAALQIAALAVAAPLCPSWDDGGVSFRMEDAASHGRRGIVNLRIGVGGDPLSDALLPSADRPDARRATRPT